MQLALICSQQKLLSNFNAILVLEIKHIETVDAEMTWNSSTYFVQVEVLLEYA